MRKSVILGLVVGSIFFAGCAGTTPSLGKLGKSSNYEGARKSGDYKTLAKELKKSEEDDLLWYLDAGLISRYAQDYSQSIYFFDKSEVKIKQYDTEVLAGKLLANIGATLTNDTFLDYRPKIYEGIMVNTYKGMDFINKHDFANARVEFNRALDRQRRAKEFFAKEISQEKKKIEEENKKEAQKKKVNFNKINESANNKKTRDVIEKKYSNLFAFKPYPDFINPFTSYMSGLFFLSVGDYAKATDILKETYGMIKDNEPAASYVKKDLLYAMNASSSILLKGKTNKHYVWIVYADGKGPKKVEKRFDIPLFLITSKVYYTGIALPSFKENPAAFKYLKVKNGRNSILTKQVASMDKVIKTEFKKRFPTIMTRAIVRTVTETMIQYELRKKGGLIGGILGAVYQGVMNRADNRQWKTLPKDFQIARIPATNRLSIYTPTGKIVKTLKTDPAKSYIVFVTIATPQSKPIVSYQAF